MIMQKSKHDDIIGKKYHKLLVVSSVGINPKTHRFEYECLCDCGGIYRNSGYKIRTGAVKSCGCSNFETTFISKYITLMYWSNIIHGAKIRELLVDILPNYLDDLWEKQNGKCYYSGYNLTLPKTAKESARYNFSASLDRIDSSLGYVKGNLAWVDKRINRMKLNMPHEDFLEFCGLVARKFSD